MDPVLTIVNNWDWTFLLVLTVAWLIFLMQHPVWVMLALAVIGLSTFYYNEICAMIDPYLHGYIIPFCRDYLSPPSKQFNGARLHSNSAPKTANKKVKSIKSEVEKNLNDSPAKASTDAIGGTVDKSQNETTKISMETEKNEKKISKDVLDGDAKWQTEKSQTVVPKVEETIAVTTQNSIENNNKLDTRKDTMDESGEFVMLDTPKEQQVANNKTTSKPNYFSLKDKVKPESKPEPKLEPTPPPKETTIGSIRNQSIGNDASTLSTPRSNNGKKTLPEVPAKGAGFIAEVDIKRRPSKENVFGKDSSGKEPVKTVPSDKEPMKMVPKVPTKFGKKPADPAIETNAQTPSSKAAKSSILPQQVVNLENQQSKSEKQTMQSVEAKPKVLDTRPSVPPKSKPLDVKPTVPEVPPKTVGKIALPKEAPKPAEPVATNGSGFVPAWRRKK